MEEKLDLKTRLKIIIMKPNQYSVFIKESIFKSLLFLLIISAITGSLLGITLMSEVAESKANIESALKEEGFKFEINNAELNFENSPYIKEGEQSSIVVIDSSKTIDTSNEIRSTFVHKDTSIVFLKDGILTRLNGKDTQIKYSSLPESFQNLDNEKLEQQLGTLDVVKYVMFILSIIGMFISITINVLIVSISGMISNSINSSPLRYGNIFKFSIYSITVPTILSILVPGIGGFGILIAALYTYIAVGTCRK